MSDHRPASPYTNPTFASCLAPHIGPLVPTEASEARDAREIAKVLLALRRKALAR